MRDVSRAVYCFLGAVSIGLCLASCGGGGGGDNTPLDDQAYTGVRTQATFSLNNAEALVFGAYGGQDAGDIMPLAADGPDEAPDARGSFQRDLTNLAGEAAEKVRAALPSVRPAALLDPSEECLNYPAGTLTDNLVSTVSGDGTRGTVKGTVTYSNCDIGGFVLDGPMKISATANLMTMDMSMDLTVDHLSTDDGVTPYTLAGYISGTFDIDEASGFPHARLTMNLTRINPANQTFWLKNYQMDEVEEMNGVRSRFSGRFYHQDHGFVDFVTDPGDLVFVPWDSSTSTFDGKLDFTGVPQSRATLWLGVNEGDYCINVFGASGAHEGDLGTCALQ